MIRHLINILLSTAIAGTLFTSCSKEKISVIESPSIRIIDINASPVSVSFTIDPDNADSFAFALTKKEGKPEFTKIDGCTAQSFEVEGLTPDTEYVIYAEAYMEDTVSERTEHSFITIEGPQLNIGEFTVTANSASVSISKTGADGFRYVTYPSGERPASPKWTDNNEKDPVVLYFENLLPETEYVLEAYPYSKECDGSSILTNFTTDKIEQPLSVAFAATSSAVKVNYELDESKVSGYYSTTLTDIENDKLGNIDAFIEDVSSNPSYYQYRVTSSSTVSSYLKADTEYIIYYVCCDAQGNILKDTAGRLTIKTQENDIFGKGKATIKITEIEYTASSATLYYDYSDDCQMYATGIVAKSQLGELTLENYLLSEIKDTWHFNSSDDMNYITIPVLEPETEYYAYAIAVDDKGEYGSVASREFKTGKIEFDPEVTVEMNLKETTFTSMTFEVILSGCTSVRYVSYQTDQVTEDDDYYFKMLYNPYAQTMPISNGLFVNEWLNYNTEYVYYILPVKQDGGYGTPKKIIGHTDKYTQEGNASATISIEKIDYDTNPDVPVAHIKITPDENCSEYLYQEIDYELYNEQKDSLGEYLCSCSYYKKSNGNEVIEMTVQIWNGKMVVAVIPKDKEGQWSPVVISDILE